jgi:hypothetical protein
MRHTLIPLTVLILLITGCDAPGTAANKSKSAMLKIDTTSLPAGTVGGAYSTQLAASGGNAPYIWVLASGQLPAGLSLDPTGLIQGTPASVGNFTFGVELQDAGVTPLQTSLSIDIAAAPAVSLSGVPGPAFIGAPYSFTPVASGGSGASLAFTLTSGALPAGLGLNAYTGEVSGTPSVLGISQATITASNIYGNSASLNIEISVHAGLRIVTSPNLPQGLDTTPWYARMDAAGGLPPYTWTVINAPAWVVANTRGDGWLEMTGIAAAGSGTFDVQAQDSAGNIAQVNCGYTVIVAPGTSEAPRINGAELPRARVGEYFEYELHCAGGFGQSIIWGKPVYGQQLPAGIYLDAWTGLSNTLRGRIDVAGAHPFDIKIDDQINPPRVEHLTLIVEPSIEALLPATVGTAYAAQPAINDGGGLPYGFGATLDSAPIFAGLNVNGALDYSGTPTRAGRALLCIDLSDGIMHLHQLVALDVRSAPAALGVVSTQLSSGIAGSAYNYRGILQAEGGSGDGYQWALAAGSSLPAGLSGLPASGALVEITGTPSQPGSYSFDVDISDSASNTVTVTVQLVIAPPTPGDFDGDGHADLMIGSRGAPSVVFIGGASWVPTGTYVYYAEPARRLFGAIGHDAAPFGVECPSAAVVSADFNGDGVADMALTDDAALSSLNPMPNRPVRIALGSATRRKGVIAKTSVDAAIGASGGEDFGAALAAGDLDGDGLADIVVGAPNATTAEGEYAGKVYIFYTAAGGPAGTRAVTSADAVLTGEVGGNDPLAFNLTGGLGDSITVEDINNDGFDDVLIGARASAYIVYGSATRLAGTERIDFVALAGFEGIWGSKLKTRLSFGDVNGDGIRDVICGARMSHVFFGQAGAMPFDTLYSSAQSDVKINCAPLSNTNHNCIAVGDFNDDGFDDIALGYRPAGELRLYHGSAAMGAGGTLDWAQASVLLTFGGSVDCALACDADNDGKDDLLVGSGSQMNLYQQKAFGAAFLLYSSSIPQSGTHDGRLSAEARFMATDELGGLGVCAAGG